jgi:hypothetical protein
MLLGVIAKLYFLSIKLYLENLLNNFMLKNFVLNNFIYKTFYDNFLLLKKLYAKQLCMA